jgi:putative transposase
MTVDQKHFAASELAGLPGMPTTARRVLERAKREAWPSRARSARGGGSEYPISCLPAVTQAALAEAIVSAAPAPSSSFS